MLPASFCVEWLAVMWVVLLLCFDSTMVVLVAATVTPMTVSHWQRRYCRLRRRFDKCTPRNRWLL